MIRRWGSWALLAVVIVGALAVGTSDEGPTTDAERAQRIATSVRCPTCRGQSVASSDAPAATNVRTAFSKNGGNLGASGSVSHGFERMGLIEYGAGAGDADKVLEAAIEAGADDVQSDEDGHEIWTSVDSLHEVAKALEGALGEAETVKLGWKPGLEVEVRGDDAGTLMKLIDALEEDDDVQTVWGNYNVPDEELEKLG